MPRIGFRRVYNRALTAEEKRCICSKPSCCDSSQVTKHDATYIVLNCIDFRLRDNLTCQLNNRDMLNNYDEFILAGASLGYNGFSSYSWKQVFEDHVDIAHSLHDITTIMIVDHMNCGAYKVAYPSITLGSQQEYDLHVSNLQSAKAALQIKYGSEYIIQTYLLSIDGCTLTLIE